MWLPSSVVVHKLAAKQLLLLRSQRETMRRPDVADRAVVTFDLDIDFTGALNWNVKQHFVFVTARWTTGDGVRRR
jgi:hypothetical protein